MDTATAQGAHAATEEVPVLDLFLLFGACVSGRYFSLLSFGPFLCLLKIGFSFTTGTGFWGLEAKYFYPKRRSFVSGRQRILAFLAE